MAKQIIWMLSAILISGMALTSCSDKDEPATSPDDPIAENLADVTIIYYGCGGGNLDGMNVGNMRELYKAKTESYKNVKVVMLYKFSKTKEFDPEAKELFRKDLEEKGEAYMDSTARNSTYLKWIGPKANATFRYVLDPEQTLQRQVSTSYLPETNIDFTHLDTLASYIRWAAEQCPAKRYMLLLTDHGRGFLPYQEVGDGSFVNYYDTDPRVQTRALLDDTGLSKSLTVFELAQAIKSAGVKISTVYFDCCLMNSLECLFELKDLCDYVVASSYT